MVWGRSPKLIADLGWASKPDEAYARERLVPGPYLELFARRSRAGWDAWGTEAGLFDGGPVATRRRPSQNPKTPGAAPEAPSDGAL